MRSSDNYKCINVLTTTLLKSVTNALLKLHFFQQQTVQGHSRSFHHLRNTVKCHDTDNNSGQKVSWSREDKN